MVRSAIFFLCPTSLDEHVEKTVNEIPPYRELGGESGAPRHCLPVGCAIQGQRDGHHRGVNLPTMVEFSPQPMPATGRCVFYEAPKVERPGPSLPQVPA